MTQTNSSTPRKVTVREVPIELCQFIKFGGLTETGGEAKIQIGAGQVTVNGVVEMQKRKKLKVGDQVTFNGQTIVVHLG
ncbi:MAG TPA: RNA-binding S4 domain-containing protein [Lacunisphaera sp.]